MEDRKVFSDSITPLPETEGLTQHGMMVNAAKPQDRDEDMTLLFSLAMPADKQADLEQKVAEGQVVSPQELKTNYIANGEDSQALVSWLKQQGYHDVQLSPNGTGVYASAKASRIED